MDEQENTGWQEAMVADVPEVHQFSRTMQPQLQGPGVLHHSRWHPVSFVAKIITIPPVAKTGGICAEDLRRPIGLALALYAYRASTSPVHVQRGGHAECNLAPRCITPSFTTASSSRGLTGIAASNRARAPDKTSLNRPEEATPEVEANNADVVQEGEVVDEAAAAVRVLHNSIRLFMRSRKLNLPKQPPHHETFNPCLHRISRPRDRPQTSSYRRRLRAR